MYPRLLMAVVFVLLGVGLATTPGCTGSPAVVDDGTDNGGVVDAEDGDGGNDGAENPDDDGTDDPGDSDGDSGNPGGSSDDGGPGGSTGKYAVFEDPVSGFSTSDVNDIDGEIVRFDTETLGIVWEADNTTFYEGLWSVEGNLIAGGSFTVRFGSKGGERRAYFTETGPATVCDFFIQQGFLIISSTNQTVPQD